VRPASVSANQKNDFLFNFGLAALAVITLFLTIVLKSKTVAIYKTDPLVFAYAIFITFFQLSRVLGAMLFEGVSKKTVPEELGRYRPFVTFIIPCKNEGPAIGKTVDKCFAADYPRDLFEVIVINDGSTDNTGEVLAERKQVYGERLTVVTWEVNQGKRHGMAEGFKRAKGEIIVQLDSDSYIDPPTFRQLIAPFRNPVIGAVCAHADPENADANFLTRMQTAYYFVSFRILKAAESTFATVFCCSGCSSAYRKSLIMPILDDWLNETFLGLPITWGDDRALTNRVIKAGYLTVYTDKARAFTIVPEDFKTFLKQQVRWKKGWFVNSLFASKFIIKKSPFVAFTYFLPLILVTLLTPFMAARAMIVNPFVREVSPFFYIAGVFLVSTIMVLYYRALDRSNKYWKYVFAWSGINMIFLSFILFYALATIQNRKWGTR
jgi:hyaluronan synthase